jgi:hypothetical protein
MENTGEEGGHIGGKVRRKESNQGEDNEIRGSGDGVRLWYSGMKW